MKKSELTKIIREEYKKVINEARINSSGEVVELSSTWDKIEKADHMTMDAIADISSFWTKEKFSDKDSKLIKLKLEKIKESKKKFFGDLEDLISDISNTVEIE